MVLLIIYKDYILFTNVKNRKILLNKMVCLFPQEENLLINLIAYLKNIFQIPYICPLNLSYGFWALQIFMIVYVCSFMF